MIHFAVDALVWLIAIPLTTFLRYDFSFAPVVASGLSLSCGIAVVSQAAAGAASGLYRRRWRYGSFDELLALAATVTSAGAVLTFVSLVAGIESMPRSVPPLATGFSVTGAMAVRSLWRLYKEKQQRPSDAEPMVVLGAGEAGYQAVRMLLTDPLARYLPVALLDDDPHKARLRVQGVRVEGTLSDLASVAKRCGARSALMAIPEADSDLIRHVASTARTCGLEFLVLPRAQEIFGSVGIGDIRPVTEADLLGRHPADIDPAAVADYVTGKRVLVTGAGGSIGSELCRQLHLYKPTALVMLDRDESGLHGVQLSIEGRATLDDPNLVLADIRDRTRMFEVFEQYRPDVVFHAAALKHLTLLEANPEEGWKTNVHGTQNVLDAAGHVGVRRFVNISTDKAANPCCVLGWTKRITERLTASHSIGTDGVAVSVRFGNVLGSRGSVLVAFGAQAEAGGPITVTDPEVTRYFMTVQEAVRLTVYAGAIGRDGEVMVLDMGEPVRILDVARRFAERSDPPLDIVFTGLRPGEKLHEVLLAPGERDERPVHPLISQVPVPALSIDDLQRKLGGGRITPATLAEFAGLPTGIEVG